MPISKKSSQNETILKLISLDEWIKKLPETQLGLQHAMFVPMKSPSSISTTYRPRYKQYYKAWVFDYDGQTFDI